MTTIDLAQLRQVAETVACAAGTLLIEGRPSGRLAVEAKSSPTDVVTAMDRAAEELIVGELARLRPHDGVIGEEGAAQTGTSGVHWLVDPLDGTVNYLYGLGGWAVSVAALTDATVIAGAVYIPSFGEMFLAVRGGGATCNGLPLRLGPGPELGQALIATGFGYAESRRAHQADVLRGVLPAIRDIRRQGACAVDLCLVAAGRVDGYFERGVKPWDHAAGGLIATEAGARFEGLHGAAPSESFALAAAPGLFGPLHDLLVEAGADGEG